MPEVDVPEASMRFHNSAHDTLCRSSVVRIQLSYDTPIASLIALKSAESPSVNVCGSTPASAAAFSTFCPCSSGAGQEEHVIPVQTLEASHHVGGNGGIGVPDMRGPFT